MSFHSKALQKLHTRESLAKWLHIWRFQGKKVVFTNGCFDILHLGHVDYLTRTRDLGNVLVLGLNSDSSVKRLGKSPERPINSEQARAAVLGAMECIDAIIIFDEDTPYELIRFVQPDVLVKGSDYKAEDIVGYDIVKANGGEVVTIPFVEGYSTTKLIEKLKK
ncbi:MAG: D-glycero-beta-D-manno-heptose 1-phosphate adenylyltransferase [Bacteroidetes bacterium]|nr:D-glycero-beta-D-manno-heptose 1-phosphate adenylyltransferase [Bacteroidota bacterium]